MHYFYLDVLRGFSAIMIVLYHYTTRYIENPITDNPAKVDWLITFPYGCAAVSTFFILSGFLTSKYIFNSDKKDIPTFVKRRFIRLYPSFLITMLSTAFVLKFFFSNIEISLLQVVVNLTMVPSLFGQRAIDGVYWTLQVELFFYLGVIFLMLIKREVEKKTFLLFWLSVPLIVKCVDNKIIDSFLNIVFIANHISLFLAGVGIFLLNKKNENKIYSLLLLFLCFISQLFLSDITQIAFFIVSIFFIIYFTRLKNVSVQPVYLIFFKKIGDISYPLYLFHQMVGFTLIYLIQTKCGISSEIVILLPILISLLYSYFVHGYIEKIIQKKFGKR